MTRTWPEDWEARKRGENCPFCEQGRIDSNEYGVRYFAGRVSDAYLQRHAPARGYSIVVFRGRHVAEPTDMTQAELVAFWTEVRGVARIIEKVFEPCQLNYQLLGNAVPHVHVHIVPRYLDDPSPERPLAFEVERVPDDEIDVQVDALVAARSPLFPTTHFGLCGDMFVIRNGRFLVLTRGQGIGEGVDYIPGGLVEPGEDPMAAAIRETREECGLDVRDVVPLRTWSYPVPEGWETTHVTFVGYSDDGEIVLTPEHTAHRWLTPDEYVEQVEAARHHERYPHFEEWFRQVHRNCELIGAFLSL